MQPVQAKIRRSPSLSWYLRHGWLQHKPWPIDGVFSEKTFEIASWKRLSKSRAVGTDPFLIRPLVTWCDWLRLGSSFRGSNWLSLFWGAKQLFSTRIEGCKYVDSFCKKESLIIENHLHLVLQQEDILWSRMTSNVAFMTDEMLPWWDCCGDELL